MQVDARDVILGLTAELNALRGKIHTQYVKEDIQLTGGRAEMVAEAEAAFTQGWQPLDIPLTEIKCADLDSWATEIAKSQEAAKGMGAEFRPYSYDDPRQRTVGFVDVQQRKYVYISLTALRGSSLSPDVAALLDITPEEFKAKIVTPYGRSVLVSGCKTGAFHPENPDAPKVPSDDKMLEALQQVWIVESEKEKPMDMGEITWVRPDGVTVPGLSV